MNDKKELTFQELKALQKELDSINKCFNCKNIASTIAGQFVCSKTKEKVQYDGICDKYEGKLW